MFLFAPNSAWHGTVLCPTTDFGVKAATQCQTRGAGQIGVKEPQRYIEAKL